MPYADFLRTDYWKQVAQQVKARDSFKCRICNSPRTLDVHHRSYQHRGWDHLHMDDLTTLCRNCHHRHHFPPEASVQTKVVVKTVVKYVEKPASGFAPLAVWALLSKSEKRFYRKAAIDLHRKAKHLCKLGRDEVLRLLAAKTNAPKPEPKKPGPAFTPPQDGLPRLNGSVVVGDLALVEADMPPGDPIVLTREILNKCRANGVFTTATARALGILQKDMTHGWATRLEGTTVSRETLLNAMRGRCLYSPATFRKRRKEERRLRALIPPIVTYANLEKGP